jgi:hypothetical protein
MVLTCVGIDSRYSTEYSNADFVHFVWANTAMLGFRRHALAFLSGPALDTETFWPALVDCCVSVITELPVRDG